MKSSRALNIQIAESHVAPKRETVSTPIKKREISQVLEEYLDSVIHTLVYDKDRNGGFYKFTTPDGKSFRSPWMAGDELSVQVQHISIGKRWDAFVLANTMVHANVLVPGAGIYHVHNGQVTYPDGKVVPLWRLFEKYGINFNDVQHLLAHDASAFSLVPRAVAKENGVFTYITKKMENIQKESRESIAGKLGSKFKVTALR